MRALVCILCLCALPVLADEAADRAAIEKVVLTFNDGAAHPELFAAGTDAADEMLRLQFVRFPRLVPLEGGPIPTGCVVRISPEPWGEATFDCAGPAGATPMNLQLRIPRIRFIAAGVALAETANFSPNSVAPRRPVLFVMKKEGAEWRVAAIRVTVF